MRRPQKYRTLPIRDCRQELARLVEQQPAILVGSFASAYPPTSLPFGMAICSALWDLIFGTGWPDWLQRDFNRLPFESLMECYPDSPQVPRIVRTLFSSRAANPVHKALTEALRCGAVSSIITTNYDQGFESCQDSPECGFITISSETDFDAFQQRNFPVCYKIHGTAADTLEHTLVYNLGREGRLSGWKRELLLSLLKDKTLLVVGYSGRDFDICPELADAEIPLQLVWLERNRRPPQANAIRALSRRQGTLVIGDFLDFLGTVLGHPIQADKPEPKVWDLRPYFDPRLVPRWQRKILDWMACTTLSTSLDSDFRLDALAVCQRQATIGGNTGRYRDAARALDKAAIIPGLDRDQRLLLEIHGAGAWFIYGRYRRAWSKLNAVERQLRSSDPSDQELVVVAKELRLVMYMRCAQIGHIFNAEWILGWIQGRSRPLYSAARAALESSGAWGRLAALRQNAERIGVAGEGELPLPAAQGYASLGFVSMDVITKRDWLRSGPVTALKERVARQCIKKSVEYGWDHEAWKFHWILLCQGRERDRIVHFVGWWHHFWRTQYPILGRLFQLLNNIPQESTVTQVDMDVDRPGRIQKQVL